MSSTDSSAGVLDALKQYFSPPIARALLLSTMRQARIGGPELPPSAVGQVVLAFEKSLPSYIAEPSRLEACIRLLRGLVPREAAPAAPVSAPAAPRPAPPSPVPLTSTVIRIATADDVANACEVGRDLAHRIGFSRVDQTKIATAIAELARNIVLYAVSGEARICGVDAPRRGIEIVTSDTGPGIADLDLVMGNTYRSRTGMGMGLKGAKRLMDTFDIATSPAGTTVKVRKFLG
jgi:serine/threonine-protein kinase RsbT